MGLRMEVSRNDSKGTSGLYYKHGKKTFIILSTSSILALQNIYLCSVLLPLQQVILLSKAIGKFEKVLESQNNVLAGLVFHKDYASRGS